MTEKNSCLNCKFAEWRRTAKGRLHPDQSGTCWVTVSPGAQVGQAAVSLNAANRDGRLIERNHAHTDCPTWKGKK